MKKILLIGLVCSALFSYHGANSATYYTVSTGNWTGNIWGATTSGPGSALPALNDGDILYIDDNISILTNIDITANITIVISATLTVDGQLKVGAGSFFQFTSSSGKIVSTPPGNSDKIFIGTGPSEWSGMDGTITGPGSFSNGWTCCALPVKLLFFEVNTENGINILSWATTMEENFNYFIVQRSVDGLIFEDIGDVPGKGFNIYDVVAKYIFDDENPLLGFNYYRLKAVDLDDSFEYFGVKAVKLEGPKKLAIYPNPSSGESISFRTNFSPSESDRIVLLDQLGVEILTAQVNVAQSSISLQNKLRAGIYTLRYISKDFEQTTRVVVKN